MKYILIILLTICCLVTIGIIREFIAVDVGIKVLTTLFVLAVCVWAIYALYHKEHTPSDKY